MKKKSFEKHAGGNIRGTKRKLNVINAEFGVVFLCAVSPTNISQYNLPPGSSSMSRSNSIPAQDSFDLYGEGHPLGGSATSLEERPRAISRSGSFRDSTDEGETQSKSRHIP